MIHIALEIPYQVRLKYNYATFMVFMKALRNDKAGHQFHKRTNYICLIYRHAMLTSELQLYQKMIAGGSIQSHQLIVQIIELYQVQRVVTRDCTYSKSSNQDTNHVCIFCFLNQIISAEVLLCRQDKYITSSLHKETWLCEGRRFVQKIRTILTSTCRE